MNGEAILILQHASAKGGSLGKIGMILPLPGVLPISITIMLPTAPDARDNQQDQTA